MVMMLRNHLNDDGVMTISLYSGKPNEVFSVNITAPLDSTTIDKYLIYTAGEMTISDGLGVVLQTRSAGDTTDSVKASIDAGIVYFECGDEQLDFYSVRKTDAARVNRVEHHMVHNTEIDVISPCLLFIALGYVDVQGTGIITAPCVLNITTPTHVTAIDDSLIVELT
jgi:hypothetical protein